MATFFEKLTGSKNQGQNIPPEPPAPTRAEVQRQIRKPATTINPVAQEAKTTHVKVAQEEPQEEEEVVEEPEEEEEGELTVDIYEKGDDIIIQSTVAGVKPEDLDVSVTNDTITIRGRREQQEEVKDKNYYYKELFWGTFSRSVILPEEIEDDMAEASLKHGLLTVKLPKKRRGVVQKLKVKVV